MSNKYANLPDWLEFVGLFEEFGQPVLRVRVKWWAVPLWWFGHLWAKLRGQMAPWP